MKRITALLLSLLMVLTLCTTAFAKSSDYHYVALGDSVPHNMRDEYLPPNQDLRYPALVRESLPDVNATLTNLSKPGIRTAEMRILLEDNYEGDDFTENFLEGYASTVPVTKELLMSNEWRTMYRDAIREADLISIELGNNDLMGNISYLLSSGKLDFGFLADLFSDGQFKLSSPAELLKLLNKTTSIVTSLLKSIAGYELTFRENWDCIIRDIRKLNPATTIVVLGFYNPLNAYAEMLGDYAKLLDLVGAPIDKLDNYVKSESPYKNEYLYADISGISGVEDAFANSSDGNFAFHPGPIGHQYIAQQILNVLEANGQPCIHEAGTPEHYFQFFLLGYTGDTYCKHCGMLLSHGTFTSLSGKTFELPKTIESDIYSAVAVKVNNAISNLLRLTR